MADVNKTVEISMTADLKSLQKAFDQNPVSFQYEDAIKILNEIKTKNYAWI